MRERERACWALCGLMNTHTHTHTHTHTGPSPMMVQPHG